MQERMVFIRAWEAGLFTMTELCEHFDVSRKTGHKWVNRYREEGIDGLKDRSRAPHTCPHETSGEIAAEIIAMRKLRTRWGPKKIIDELRRISPETAWPAESTAGEILKKAGLVKRRRRRRRVGVHMVRAV